jgi:uncharacterized protein
MSDSKNTEHNPGNMTPLHLAAVRAKLAKVQQLISDGADPHALNIDGQPPLFNALECAISDTPEIKATRAEAFNLLWDNTTEKRLSQDKQGNTVLHLMAVYGFEHLIRDYIEEVRQLADVPTYYNDRTYPIHKAILNRRFDAAKALFELDPKTPHYRDKNNQSPLHYAVRYGPKDMVELCCEHQKNNLDERDRNGKTALAWAIEGGRTEVKEYLIQQGADEDAANSRTATIRR